MGAMNVQVIKSTSNSVKILVTATVLELDATSITWANLSPLFDHPDGATPGGQQQASVTGERQKNRAHLVCRSISWSNNEAGANGPEMAVTWAGETSTLLYPLDGGTSSHTFSGSGATYNGGTLDATNAVTCGAVVNLGADEYMRVEFEFSSSNPSI